MILVVDKKSLGYFSMKELINLLSHYKFEIDKQHQLLEAFREIDHDADGFISKADLTTYMQTMGEPLDQNEMKYMLDLAADPSSKNRDLINIEKLSKLMMPSDDIIEELTQQANEKIKKAEAEAKLR